MQTHKNFGAAHMASLCSLVAQRPLKHFIKVGFYDLIILTGPLGERRFMLYMPRTHAFNGRCGAVMAIRVNPKSPPRLLGLRRPLMHAHTFSSTPRFANTNILVVAKI